MENNNQSRAIRILSVLLTVILLFSSLGGSFVVSADASHTHDGVTFTKWESTSSLPSSAGNYYLAADVTISSTWSVPEGTTNLCLNGHGIRLTGGTTVVRVNSGTFTLYDCGDTTHYFTAPENGYGKATNISDTDSGGQSSFTGGYITGGTAQAYDTGGGVHVASGATFVMKGGNIIGNGSNVQENTRGGGVAVDGGKFNMEGGAILYNIVYNEGGGVYLKNGAQMQMTGGIVSHNYAKNGSGGVHMNSGVSFTMSGGEIAYNHVGTTGGEGGGMCAYQGSLTMTGGSIHHNSVGANGLGGGVLYKENGTLILSGSASIIDNKAGEKTQNIYIRSKIIQIAGAFTTDARFGVTVEGNTGKFTSGWSTYMTDGEGNVANPANYFVSDGGYEIVLIGSEANIHQHNYGDLIAEVEPSCEADGMAAHYYCADCGQYFDESKEKISKENLIIAGGHSYVRRNKVDATCTEYGKREHFYCTECGLYFNTNKQQVAEWSLSIGTLGHDYDLDNAVFTWTPDDSAYYKWKVTVSYSCKRCGDLVEKNAGIEGKSATWNQDSCIRAYVYANSQYYYSDPIYRDSDAGTATMNSWTPWEYDDRLPDAKPEDANSKGWYLTKDVTLTDTWTVPKTNYPYLTLCLNGHVITGNFDTSKTIIYVPKGVEFELCEYNFDETHYYYIGKTVTDSHGNELNFIGQIASGEDDPNYISAARKDSFKGGYITGGTGRVVGGNTYGGAVYIDGDTSTKYYNCGEFKSTGVTFFGNYADYGGAVYVAPNAYFDFSSGNIIGNQAGNEGGGVYANKRAYSDNQYGNYGMQSSSGKILYNTAGQGGNGYGGGIAGWAYLPYGSIDVMGNAAVGENAKGGGVYGFLKVMDSHIYANYTTGLGPGLYATNYNFTVDNSTSHICIYNNRYASSVTVNEIELISRRGDLYFASGYTLQLIGTSYPPSKTDGVRAYVEMASGTGNFATNWTSSYSVYENFAANPGYKINQSGSTLSLQSSGGDYPVNLAQSFVAYTTYYYANGTPASYISDETHRYVFSGTQSVNSTFGVYGYLKGDNSIYLRFDNLHLTATGTNSLFQISPSYGDLDVYIDLVGDSVLTTNGRPALYGGRADMSLNIYFTGSGTLTVIDNAEGSANNLFGPYNNNDIHIYLGGEDITIYELVKEKIANIGFVTYSQEIKERITTARTAYDILDDKLKVKVTNYPDLLAAEASYELAAAAEIVASATGYTGDYDGEAHGITVTVTNPEDATVKYGTQSGVYTLDSSPTFTEAGTYKVYYQVTKEKYNTVSDFATVTINKINATVTITGHNSTVDYDKEEHSVSGYEVVADTTLYDVSKDFTFSGEAVAKQTNAGTANMGLAASQFASINENFATVTFNVTDGYQTINPRSTTVTITGHYSADDYDKGEHSVSGYDAVADTALYDVTKDFTFSGNATVKRTDVGTADMGLAASQFANVNSNFDVTFVVVDGYQTINKIKVTVTIVGNNSTVDYDGTEHKVTGYVVTANNDLYDLSSNYTFNGDATAKGINAGTYYMGLAASQFANINSNFDVTFLVTDGYQTVNKINATVTITGHNSTVDYNGSLRKVTGYDAVADTPLYDVTTDFNFSGLAIASRVYAGKTGMGLAPEQFSNENPNFATVTFIVTDGYQIVLQVPATVTTEPQARDLVYNGSEQELILAGETDCGTLYYALGASDGSAPADSAYSAAIPTAQAAGSYVVWYKVVADGNHWDSDPASLKVRITDEGSITVSGVLYASDGTTPLEGATVSLVRGEETIDVVTTESDGAYRFVAPDGVYNLVAKTGQNTVTALLSVDGKTERDLVMPEGKTDSYLKVKTDEESELAIVVGGLDREAQEIRASEGVSADQSVSLTMTVEQKTEETAANAEAFLEAAKGTVLDFFEITVAKTVGSVTTALDTTKTVMEIVIPYKNAAKKGLTVYSYHGSEVRKFVQSESRDSGTFRADAENGLVYIYSNSFSTYAIGYTPSYRVSTSLSLGSYTGNVTVTLTSQEDGSLFTLENVAFGDVVFENIPKGNYLMTLTWEDGATNTITMPLTVEPPETETEKTEAALAEDAISTLGESATNRRSPIPTAYLGELSPKSRRRMLGLLSL